MFCFGRESSKSPYSLHNFLPDSLEIHWKSSIQLNMTRKKPKKIIGKEKEPPDKTHSYNSAKLFFSEEDLKNQIIVISSTISNRKWHFPRRIRWSNYLWPILCTTVPGVSMWALIIRTSLKKKLCCCEGIQCLDMNYKAMWFPPLCFHLQLSRCWPRTITILLSAKDWAYYRGNTCINSICHEILFLLCLL